MRPASIIHTLVNLVLLLLAVSPLLGLVWVGYMADRYDCQVDEGSVHPCIVNGEDIGETLYTWGVMGWMMFVTLPLGLGAAGIYLLVVIVFYVVRRSLRSRAAKQAAGEPG